ncbi:MAG TPA: NAD(P)/FAD-dependent oxidoreductase [Ruminiclostridium sp.]
MYDVIIIGKGPSGISASLYTQRSNLKTLIIGREGSSLEKAGKIENYYGLEEPISGEKLLSIGEKQAESLGVKILNDEVAAITEVYEEKHFKVSTITGEYYAKAVLIATGQPQKKVDIDGLKAFEGKGVSYCTTCDGFFYKNMSVGVLGYSAYAVHEAMELETFTKDITLFTNGAELDVTADLADKAGKFKVNTRPILELTGDEFLQGIHFKDGKIQKVDGLFVAYGSASSVDFAKKLGIIVENNAIVVDHNQCTNIEGIFAAGDCTGGFKQIATAVGQGAVAGKGIIEFIKALKKKL